LSTSGRAQEASIILRYGHESTKPCPYAGSGWHPWTTECRQVARLTGVERADAINIRIPIDGADRGLNSWVMGV
jgi:hypothetical protein